jgi:TRAP transporter TAXI family solute receptor
MMHRSALLLTAALYCGILLSPVTAQSAEDLKSRTNRGAIGVISGGIDGTYVRIAADLAAVIGGGDSLRVLPVLGQGSVQNVMDLLYLRGIDVGIVQSDVLAFVKRENTYPGIEKRLQYIAKLYNEEFHVLAGKDVKSIGDLAGQKVNFDVRGSGTFMTATLVFDALKIKVEPVSNDQALALEMVRKGEIAALVYVAGKPARLFRDLKPEDGVKLLEVPQTPELMQTYLPSRLTPEDYGVLTAPVDTVAVGAVMAVVSFPPESERFRNLAHFTDVFFAKFPAFLDAPRHPKWKEVNLSAQLPGWTRFAPAEAWLKRTASAPSATSGDSEVRKAFDVFLDQQAKATGRPATPGQKGALFEQFLQWEKSQRQ